MSLPERDYIGPFSPEQIKAVQRAMWEVYDADPSVLDWEAMARAGLGAAVAALDREALVETVAHALLRAQDTGRPRWRAEAVIAALFPTEGKAAQMRAPRQITRGECLACGREIKEFKTTKSRGTVTVVGCPHGHGFVIDREGRRRPWDEVSRLVVYREVLEGKAPNG